MYFSLYYCNTATITLMPKKGLFCYGVIRTYVRIEHLYAMEGERMFVICNTNTCTLLPMANFRKVNYG